MAVLSKLYGIVAHHAHATVTGRSTDRGNLELYVYYVYVNVFDTR